MYAMMFVRSIYESKRCWLRCSRVLEELAMQKHKTIMSTERVAPFDAVYAARLAACYVIPPGTKYEPGNCVPRASACQERARSEGGAHAEESIDPTSGAWKGLGDYEGLAMGESGSYVSAISREQAATSLWRSIGTRHRVTYQSIPEPGKTRSITKGPASTYTSFRPLQRVMLNAWAQMSCSTMRPDVVEWLDERFAHKPPEDEFFISGDYSNATDAMCLNVTLAVMDQILRNLGIRDTLLAEEALRSFRGAQIAYPDGTFVNQVRGQLMGHPLSFPLLCIINLSTFLRTKNVQSPDELDECLLAVNGDDILFTGDRNDYVTWRSYADEVGLVVNEMKTYTHPKFALINSILFSPRRGQVRYHNRALAIGARVKSEPTRMLGTAPAIWEQLCIPHERSTKLNRRHFIQSLRCRLPVVKLGKIKFEPNFFIPRHLGGIGLTTERFFRITRSQRLVATYFARNPQAFLLSEKLGEQSNCCRAAIETAMKCSPALESWIIDGRPVHGPLPEWEDPDTVMETYLARALLRKAWIKGNPPASDDYVLRHAFKRALRQKESLMSSKKIRGCRVPRFRIVSTPLPKPACKTDFDDSLFYHVYCPNRSIGAGPQIAAPSTCVQL
jgi:hypothetical protein